MKIILCSCLLGFVLGSCRTEPKEQCRTREEVLAEIARVNECRQLHYPPPVISERESAAYHIGNMAAYQATGNRNFLRYSEKWAELHRWQGCHLVYVELYKTKPDEHKLSDMRRQAVRLPVADRRWLADNACDRLPVLAGLYEVTGDVGYLDCLHSLFDAACQAFYDKRQSLFSSGNDRMFAALAQVVGRLPLTDIHRGDYLKVYMAMAKTLSVRQHPKGYWHHASKHASAENDADRTTTALMAYAYLWGINYGVLDKNTYQSIALRAWNYSAEHIDQPSATGRTLGVYLMATSEMAEYLRKYRNVNDRTY